MMIPFPRFESGIDARRSGAAAKRSCGARNRWRRKGVAATRNGGGGEKGRWRNSQRERQRSAAACIRRDGGGGQLLLDVRSPAQTASQHRVLHHHAVRDGLLWHDDPLARHGAGVPVARAALVVVLFGFGISGPTGGRPLFSDILRRVFGWSSNS